MEELKKRIKVILETDNGDDIDDLFTIYAMLGDKDAEVVGIVSTYLNTPLRARQVRHVLELANRKDIPVFAGCGYTLGGYHDRPTNLKYCQYSEILDSPKYYSNEDKDTGFAAISFLIESAKRYKDELYICEIGPQCTLARAIKKDRDAFKNTHIHIMGGSFFKRESEWNIECDVESAKIVLQSGLNLNYCSLDVTRLSMMSKEDYDRYILINKDEYINYLIESTKLWYKSANRIPTLHDPLTYISMHHDVVNYQRVKVRMNVDEEHHKVYFDVVDDSCLDKDVYTVNVSKTIKDNKFFEIIYELIGIKKEVSGG